MSNILLITVVTRNLDDPDEPPQRQLINYNNPDARQWLGSHSLWALTNNHSVTTMPASGIIRTRDTYDD